MPVEIRQLSKDDVDVFADLHLRYLRTRFQGNVGNKLLRAYYENLIQQEGGCGYTAVSDGRVAGFVCGIWNAALVKKTLVRGYWRSLLSAAIQALILSPRIVLGLISRLFDADKIDAGIIPEGYELRPIVVDPAFRGSDAAPALVTALGEDARDRGFGSIFLITELDNIAANKFYMKQGFIGTGVFVRSGQEYQCYIKEL